MKRKYIRRHLYKVIKRKYGKINIMQVRMKGNKEYPLGNSVCIKDNEKKEITFPIWQIPTLINILRKIYYRTYFGDKK